MPPRITRLKWPRLFPKHEPLLFVHPRWYSVEPAAVEATRQTPIDDDDEQLKEQLQILLHDESKEQGVKPRRKPKKDHGKDQDGLEGIIKRVPSSIARLSKVQGLQEKKRRELRERNFLAHDWLTPLALLRKHTPKDAMSHVNQLERLQIPKGMRGFYTGDLKELILEIYLHTGCHVQVSRSDGTVHVDEKFSALDLAGSVLSIKLAKKILDDAVQVERIGATNDKADKTSMESYPSTTTPLSRTDSAPRAVWATRHVPTRRKHLSELRVPRVWTTIKFASYIEELILTPEPPLSPRRRTDTPRPRPHSAVVAEKLLDLYSEPTAIRCASMHATLQTLKFLSQHRKLPEVRRILGLVEFHSKTYPLLRMILSTPRTFNILLHHAAEALDLHSYHFALRIMIDNNVAPDYETWTSLLTIIRVRSPKDAKHVVAAMKTRNLIESPAANIATANAMIKQDVESWLKRGESIFDFVAHYDRRRGGKEWLDPRACNTMMSACIKTGNPEDALDLLNILHQRFRRPNLASVHILLDAACAYTKLGLDFAIKALEATLDDHVVPDRHTYGRMARLAWKRRAMNAFKVIWQYACLSGNVSYSLLRRMEKSLDKPLPVEDRVGGHVGVAGVMLDAQDLSRQKRFNALAAKVALIIGVPPVSEPTTLVPLGADTLPRPAEAEAEAEAEARPRPKAKTPYQQQLTRDMDAHKHFTPVNDLLSVLKVAVAKDHEWRGKGYESAKKCPSLDVLTQQAIQIPVQVRGKKD
jgi:pentatricopeptide repeat protein